MNPHTAAGYGVEVDLEGHLIVAAPQTEKAADGALIAAFADAQHRATDQRGEQAIALIGGQLADIDGIALTGNCRIIGQQSGYGDRSTGGLGRALDQIVGVLGRADHTQSQLRRLHGPAGITENSEHHLGDRFGTLIGHADGRFRLSGRDAS